MLLTIATKKNDTHSYKQQSTNHFIKNKSLADTILTKILVVYSEAPENYSVTSLLDALVILFITRKICIAFSK